MHQLKKKLENKIVLSFSHFYYKSKDVLNCSSGNERKLFDHLGGGPRVVVSTAAFHARVWGSVPGLGGLKETKMFLPHLPRGSVLGLRPPGLEFRILCLKDSVISIISPPSGGSPGSV